MIENICEKVYKEVTQSNNQNASLNQWVITRLDGLDGEAADSGPGKYCLCNDSSGQESAKLKPHDRYDGEERVAERMFKPDLPLAEPFGPGSLDIILIDYLEQTGADHSG